MRKCIPQVDAPKIIPEHHDSSFGGHFGEEITKQRILRTFSWPTIVKDVREHVKTCVVCQKQSRNRERNTHHRYETTKPFEMVFIDYVINLPVTRQGNRHKVTIADDFIR